MLLNVLVQVKDELGSLMGFKRAQETSLRVSRGCTLYNIKHLHQP